MAYTLHNATIAATYDRLFTRNSTVPSTGSTTTGIVAMNDSGVDIVLPLYISTQRVGIGTSSPAVAFHVQSTAAQISRIESVDDDCTLQISSHTDEDKSSTLAFLSGTTARGAIGYDHHATQGSQLMQFFVGDNAVTAMTIKGDGNVGIGTAVPGSQLQIESAGSGVETSLQIISYSGTAADDSSQIILLRSRGTASDPACPPIVADDDSLGKIEFMGADGSDFNHAVRIEAFVDGTPSDGTDMPGRLVFSTSANSSNAPTPRMTINSVGRVGIGTAAPETDVHINNTSIATLFLSRNMTSGLFNDNQDVGRINFGGHGDATTPRYGAAIFGTTAEEWSDGNTDNGMALQFLTCDNGTAILDVRMKINENGVVSIVNLSGSGSRAVNASSAGVLSAASDKSLKEEVLDAAIPGLAEILQLKPVAYKWLDDIENRGSDAAIEIGFFANDVAPIIPSAAPKCADGLYGFYDRSVTAALVKAIQELSAKVTALENA